MRALIISLVCVAVGFIVSHAAILYVSKSRTATYTEVQPAINAASPGDTILIAPHATSYQGSRLTVA